MRNTYGSLVETWKVDLIVARAKLKGFREWEIGYVQQDIIRAVVAFRFDPSRSNGASESTALTAVIDKQLTCLRRGEARRNRHEDRYRQVHGVRERRAIRGERDPAEPRDSDHTRLCGLSSDVRHTIPKLSPLGQEVGVRLMQGERPSQIAKRLGVSRHAVGKAMVEIRDLFAAQNLDEWMHER